MRPKAKFSVAFIRLGKSRIAALSAAAFLTIAAGPFDGTYSGAATSTGSGCATGPIGFTIKDGLISGFGANNGTGTVTSDGAVVIRGHTGGAGIPFVTTGRIDSDGQFTGQTVPEHGCGWTVRLNRKVSIRNPEPGDRCKPYCGRYSLYPDLSGRPNCDEMVYPCAKNR